MAGGIAPSVVASGVCQAMFRKMPSYQVPQTRQRAEWAGRQAGVHVDFKQRSWGNVVELGVRFCGNQYDVQRAVRLLRGYLV